MKLSHVVVGERGSLVDQVMNRIGASTAGVRSIEPQAARLAELPALAEDEVWAFVALAGVGLAGTPDLEGAQQVFMHAERAGLRRLVLVASTAIYEPSHHHPAQIHEDQRALRHISNPIAARWLDLEVMARDWRDRTGAALAILRCAPVIHPDGSDYFSRLLASRWAVTPVGFDPSLQFATPEDLASAIVRVVEAQADGVFHVAPRAVMPLRQALRVARCRRLPVPTAMQWLPRRLLASRGRVAPCAQLDYLKHSFTVSPEKLVRELRVPLRHTSEQAIETLVEPRPSAGRPQAPAAVVARDASEVAQPDPFGLDEAYVTRLGKTLFRFLHDHYWRVEWRGLEHIPRSGRAVIAGVHRGHQPWDGVMTFHLLARELGRYMRFLIHPSLVKFPFLAPYMIKCGGIHACLENAAWVLERDGLLGIYPEGIRGAFTLYRDAYRLGKFGRDEYVRIALRHRAPIVPHVTVGSAEIFPILARVDWPWFRRVSEWPFLPITPTMGTVPLPSKWHTWFLEPISVEDYAPEAADDRATVKAISQEVRERMEAAIEEMLRRRKSIFWGSIFETQEDVALGEEPA
ncbi:MAG: 1-acyl-sn-glycerol-3-phosphate acyltransferase [Acidobacteriota bacterium]